MLKNIKEKTCHFTGRLRAGWLDWWWVAPEADVVAGLARLRDSLSD